MKTTSITMATALLAATFTVLPAQAGLLGGSGGGGLGGALGGGLSPRGLDLAGSGNANAQGDLKARRAAEQARDKATEGTQAAGDKAKAGVDSAGQRLKDGAARTDGQANAAAQGSRQDGVTQLGGNAAGQLQRRPVEATPSTATPAPAAAPAAPAAKRGVDANGSAQVSRSERSVDAQAQGNASVQR